MSEEPPLSRLQTCEVGLAGTANPGSSLNLTEEALEGSIHVGRLVAMCLNINQEIADMRASRVVTKLRNHLWEFLNGLLLVWV